jgi:glutamate 5-kinase
VSAIDDFQQLEQLRITQATSVLGSGGMRSKVVAAEMATAAGIPTVIANGQLPGTIIRAAAGEPIGTTFSAQDERHSSFKLWLKYAKPVRGRVQVDAGAARALREGGTSLLPVGVVDVEGVFEAGDAIDVLHGAEQVGKGISNYSADELRRARGRRSSEVRELLPLVGDEAIHRDYFVLA